MAGLGFNGQDTGSQAPARLNPRTEDGDVFTNYLGCLNSRAPLCKVNALFVRANSNTAPSNN